EASQKQKAFNSGAVSSHVTKHTRSALAQSSSNTTPPSLFVDNSNEESDDDDNAYVEIPLVTPICSTAIIPSLGNQGKGFAALAAKDSRGKGIMTDATVASSTGVSLPWPSTKPAPSLKKVFGDAIHRDLFPFSAVP
ncbi:hypothetical protein Tco_0338597, partial [Tanacetum coccineum]